MAVALITGASSGLGYEFSKILAKKNYDLVIVAQNEEKLLQVQKELEDIYKIKTYVYAKDLTETDASEKVFEFTKNKNLEIKVLINNAGFGDLSDFASCDINKQNNMVKLNITALMNLTYKYLPEMIKNHYGKILNISSIASFCAGPKMAVYYASKSFVLRFSEAVAEEVKGSGVTVTALCPAPTATGFEKNANMTNSKAFKVFKPSNASDVARMGIDAMMKGKVVKYCGFRTGFMNFLARVVPRSWSRKYIMKLNQKR